MNKVYFEIIEEETRDRIKSQIETTIKENEKVTAIWKDFAQRCGSPKPHLLAQVKGGGGVRLAGIYFKEPLIGWDEVMEDQYEPTYKMLRKIRKEFKSLPWKKFVNESFLPEYDMATYCQATRLWLTSYIIIGDRYFLQFVDDDDHYPLMQKDPRLKEIKEWEYLKIVDEAKEEGSK